MMAGIRGKNTKPETLVRKALFKAGFRFRLHRKDLPGAPDVVLPGRRVVVFVHGCFWHAHSGCPYAKVPATRREFWLRKLSGNVERDTRARVTLLAAGWRVLTVWECATKDSSVRNALPDILKAWITGSEVNGDIAGFVGRR